MRQVLRTSLVILGMLSGCGDHQNSDNVPESGNKQGLRDFNNESLQLSLLNSGAFFNIDGNVQVSYFEAENAMNVSGSFGKLLDSRASAGAYMQTPKGGSISSSNYLAYRLKVSNGGSFYIQLLGAGLDDNSNSVYVAFDTGSDNKISTSSDNSWGWKKYSNSISLANGFHTLFIKQKEAGTKIDKIALSKSSSSLSGLGDTSLQAQTDSGSGVVSPPVQTSCTYALSSSLLNVTAAGLSNASITMTTQTGCAFTTVSQAPFIRIISGMSGQGTSTISFSVDANSTSIARTGTISAGGRVFTISQAAAPVAIGNLNPQRLPSQNFDLRRWKLTIPGAEIWPWMFETSANDINQWFHTDPTDGSMVFWLDSKNPLTTENASTPRSELREIMDGSSNYTNWHIAGTHVLSARVKFKDPGTTPDQVTFIQIHGWEPNGSDIKPLLRLTLYNKSDIKAYYKTDDSGSNTSSEILATGIGFNREFDVEVRVENNHLLLKINGVVKFDKSVSYWTHYNYFKAGDYAQATSGISQVHFYKLIVTH